MNNLKKIFLVITGICSSIYAQQEPHYTQYMYNPGIINPAYAGSSGSASIFALYRAQWIGLEGAPTTASVTFQKPIDGTHLGYGVSVVNDRIGPSDETQISVDLAYTIFLGNENRIAFGIKGTGDLLTIDYSKLTQYDPDEFVIQNDISGRFSPNIGVGMFYYNASSYFGVSIPMFLDTKRYDDAAYATVNQRTHLYFIGGKVFDLNGYIKFKPAFAAKAVSGAPLQVDLSTNFLYDEKFTFGLSYRWSSSVSAMAGFKLNDNIYIGYAYDVETTKLARYNSGSHEVFLLFDLFGKSSRVNAPRFF